MPLHEFIVCVHLTLHGKETLKLAANCIHRDPIFSSPTPDWDRKERWEKIHRYSSTKTFLAQLMEKPENMKYARFWALLNTGWNEFQQRCVRRNPTPQVFLLLKMGGRFLINRKDCSLPADTTTSGIVGEESGVFSYCKRVGGVY